MCLGLFPMKVNLDNASNAIYLEGYKDSVHCVQFDEDKILTGSRGKTVRIWDARVHQR